MITTQIPPRNFYKVLGVRPEATPQEIEQAFEKIVRRFDSTRAETFEKKNRFKERMAAIQEAFDTLSDPERRKAYDVSLKEREGNGIASAVEQVKPALLSKKKPGAKGVPGRHNVYQDYYGFSEKPFDLTPDPKYLYLSPKHKEVLAHLVYGLQENNGFLKIIGEVGTGKTTICRSFLKELHDDFSIAYIFNPCMNQLELLQSINSELGLPSKTQSKKQLIDTLNRFLLTEREKGHRVVVIVDEAQDLQPMVLEQLRLLSNLETETAKLIQIVLIGQPELDTLLASENLRQLRQRITISWELLPLNIEETRGYIQHRLNVALGKGKVRFSRAALKSIFRYSHGIPRMINVVTDRALLIGYTLNTKAIDSRVVKLAVKDIGGLKPITTAGDRFFKTGLPLAAGLAVLFYGMSHYVLPDLTPDPTGGKNIKEMVQKAPAELGIPTPVLVPARPVPDPAQPASGAAIPGPVPEAASPAVSTPAAGNPRRVASPIPLVITEENKLVTYLASLSLQESKIEAARWVLKSWGIEDKALRGLNEAQLEKLNETFGLIPYEMNGNMGRLQTFNYPALLEIALPHAQGTKYLALLSVKGNGGTFASVDRIEMPLSVIDSLWTRKAILFWSNYEQLPDDLEPGFRGKEAIWLQKNLRLLGYFQGPEASVYGPKTVDAVQMFQREHNIRDDGRFLTESQLLMYNLLNIYPTPKLLAE